MFGNTHYREGGSRGGAAEFKWENVKGDQSYLGACLHAPRVGRRDVDRDWFWFTKTKDTMGRGLDRASSAAETKALRRLEILERQKADMELLSDALGETTESKRGKIDLEMAELKRFLERGNRGTDDSGERVAGLGAAPAKRHDHVLKDEKVQREMDRQQKDRKTRDLIAADNARRRAVDPATLDNKQGGVPQDQGFVRDEEEKEQRDNKKKRHHENDDDDAAARQKADRRLAKKAKKDAKKAAKKHKKKHRRHRHDSDSSSSD